MMGSAAGALTGGTVAREVTDSMNPERFCPKSSDSTSVPPVRAPAALKPILINPRMVLVDEPDVAYPCDVPARLGNDRHRRSIHRPRSRRRRLAAARRHLRHHCPHRTAGQAGA